MGQRHLAICFTRAVRSYVQPSAASTGSLMMPRLMGHTSEGSTPCSIRLPFTSPAAGSYRAATSSASSRRQLHRSSASSSRACSSSRFSSCALSARFCLAKFCTSEARAPKRSALSDSPACCGSWDAVTTTAVRALPPKQFRSSCVNFESR